MDFVEARASLRYGLSQECPRDLAPLPLPGLSVKHARSPLPPLQPARTALRRSHFTLIRNQPSRRASPTRNPHMRLPHLNLHHLQQLAQGRNLCLVLLTRSDHQRAQHSLHTILRILIERLRVQPQLHRAHRLSACAAHQRQRSPDTSPLRWLA